MKKKSVGLAAALVLALAHPPLLAQAPAPVPKKPVAKKDSRYTGYEGKKWDRDYGVVRGNCDIASIAPEAAKKDRGAAVLRGESKLGKLDNGDRGCAGHALELALEKKTVAWTNKQSGVTYRLTPTRNIKQGLGTCREFNTTVITAGKKQDLRSVACRNGDGEWILK